MRSTRVVILNYRTASLTIDCLRSLVPQMRDEIDCQAIVVDNASPDDSVSQLRQAIEAEQWDDVVTLLPHDRNGGFAAGNNAGMRWLLEQNQAIDFFWLLNPDTIVLPRALKTLLEFLEQHPKVGIVGSRLVERDGTVQNAAFRFHSVLNQFEFGIRLGPITKLLRNQRVTFPQKEKPFPCDWVSGASFLIRRAVLDDIGLMDENYFLYFEETDWCIRTKRAGWQIWHQPESQVIHLEGQSSGIAGSKSGSKPMPRYWFESRARYFRKNHGNFYLFLVNMAFVFGFVTWRIRRRLQRKPDPDPPGFLWDFLRYSW